MRDSILRAMPGWPRRLAMVACGNDLAARPAGGGGAVRRIHRCGRHQRFLRERGWLKNRSITLGCTSATLFCPNDVVNRLADGGVHEPARDGVDAGVAAGGRGAGGDRPGCQSGGVPDRGFRGGGFARVAYADLRFSGNATADVGLAAELVMSLDAGATWASLNLFSSRGLVAANQWGTLTNLGFANLDLDQSARWGVRMSRLWRRRAGPILQRAVASCGSASTATTKW